MPAVTAPEDQSCWSCDSASLSLMSSANAALPGPTKDKHRHSWQRTCVLVLTGSLEVRRKCQESAWHVHSEWKEHLHQNTRQRVAVGWFPATAEQQLLSCFRWYPLSLLHSAPMFRLKSFISISCSFLQESCHAVSTRCLVHPGIFSCVTPLQSSQHTP